MLATIDYSSFLRDLIFRIVIEIEETLLAVETPEEGVNILRQRIDWQLDMQSFELVMYFRRSQTIEGIDPDGSNMTA